MLLNGLSNENVKIYAGNSIVNQKKLNNKKINSGIDRDCFTPLSNVRLTASNFSEDISKTEQENIKKNVLDAASGKIDEQIGAGADGAVYQIDNNLVVKISHTENKNPLTGEMQRTNAGYETEINMLKLLSDFDKNSQKYVADFKLNDGRSALVTTLVHGDTPGIHKKEHKLNKDNLASLLNILYTLDEKNVLHRDLKKENIKINNKDEAGLFDFGAAIKFDINDFNKNTNENNFPEFEVPTNLRNFEDTLLSPYLHDLSKTNPKEAKKLFCDYIKLKSEFHQKKAELINKLLKNNNLNSEEKKQMSNILHYEKTLAAVFKNPDDDIIETELLKNNITYNAELAYKNEILLLNPLANVSLKMSALISAKKLEKLTEAKLNRPNTQEKRDYYNYKNQEAKYRGDKIGSWTIGLTGWLVECLTTKANQLNEGVKNVITQCCDKKKNLCDFEIPNLSNEIMN